MIFYGLPTTVEIDGTEYPIRSDYRAILDIISALNDPELGDEEKAFIVMDIFYEDMSQIPAEGYRAALEECFKFIDCGEENKQSNAKQVVDWEQDFRYIIAPINAVAGKEIRAEEYLHWWTFISLYGEISGDCTFAQIVRIREKQSRGKALDKVEQEWYNRNRALVDRRQRFTSAEEEIMRLWGNG